MGTVIHRGNTVRKILLAITLALVFLLAAGLAAIALIPDSDIPPPRATDAQVRRETIFLLQRFFMDDCFRRMVGKASWGSGNFDNYITYRVEFPLNLLVSDGFKYTLVVRHSDRKAYLVMTGGFGGTYQSVGPLRLAKCMQEVFVPPGPEAATAAENVQATPPPPILIPAPSGILR